MKKLISILFFLTNIAGKCYSQRLWSEFLYAPESRVVSWTNMKLQEFYKELGLAETDNYVVIDSCFMELGKVVQKLNEVYIYDSIHRRLKFYEGIRCTNNKMLLSNFDFSEVYLEMSSAHYDSIVGMIKAISETTIDNSKYTAIIVWNKRLGIQNDDNFIEWEKLLRARFGNRIKIMKINYDSNESYRWEHKDRINEMFNHMYSAYYRTIQKQ